MKMWHRSLICKLFIGMTPRPPHPKILKTAMGSAELVSLGEDDHISTLQTVLSLKSRGIKVYGIETTDNSTTLWDAPIPNENVAYVFGNELIGVGKLTKFCVHSFQMSIRKVTVGFSICNTKDVEVLRECDNILSLPTYGIKNSLNIANCASIVLWETLRRWRTKNSDNA